MRHPRRRALLVVVSVLLAGIGALVAPGNVFASNGGDSADTGDVPPGLVRGVPGSDRVWVAGGYSGHGNVLGFACGRMVARAILGDRDPLLELFRPERLLNA